ncbi:histidine triad nucleotide-binding protein [Ectothiorhodospiraceae bacterium 2226]|nr:histidine triad nucleotide-binding protein [Ectothiorhodospiraceae bacterium 2226]
MDCIFCRLAEGDEGSLLYRDEHVAAFRDINPQAPHHILIVPRRHLATLNALEAADAEVAGRLTLTAQRLANELGFAEAGYRVVMNCNGHGGQTVFHIHLHLLGGRAMGWPPG